jgi:hypothetical protein
MPLLIGGPSPAGSGHLSKIRSATGGTVNGQSEYLGSKLAVAFDTLGSFPAVRDFVMNELVTKADLALALDNLKSELTVRLGGMIAAGFAVLAVLQGFH